MISPAQDGSNRIQNMLASFFVQWVEMEMCCPDISMSMSSPGGAALIMAGPQNYYHKAAFLHCLPPTGNLENSS